MNRHTLACVYGFACRIATLAVVLAALFTAWRIFHPSASSTLAAHP